MSPLPRRLTPSETYTSARAADAYSLCLAAKRALAAAGLPVHADRAGATVHGWLSQRGRSGFSLTALTAEQIASPSWPYAIPGRVGELELRVTVAVDPAGRAGAAASWTERRLLALRVRLALQSLGLLVLEAAVPEPPRRITGEVSVVLLILPSAVFPWRAAAMHDRAERTDHAAAGAGPHGAMRLA